MELKDKLKRSSKNIDKMDLVKTQRNGKDFKYFKNDPEVDENGKVIRKARFICYIHPLHEIHSTSDINIRKAIKDAITDLDKVEK